MNTEPQTIAIWLVLGITAYTTWRGFQRDSFLDQWIFSPARVLRDKQIYRLVSSGFIHGDWQHLFFNLFSLYAFGHPLEAILGPGVFLLIYFSSILGGSLLSLFLHRHHDYRALGASGGVCGIIFAAIFLLPGGGVIMFPLPITMPSWLYAILFILVSFFGMRHQRDNVGHDAHLGGALVGLGVTTLLYPAIITQNPFLYTTVIVLTGSLFIFAYQYPPHLQTGSPFTRDYWQRRWSEKRHQTQQEQHASDKETLEALLVKISESGIKSLTTAERGQLAKITKRINKDNQH